MGTIFSNFIIIRKDKFILHTKRISLERAKWLLNEAYKSVDSRGLEGSQGEVPQAMGQRVET